MIFRDLIRFGIFAAGALSLALAGCGNTGETTANRPASRDTSQVGEARRQQALDHVVEGSVFQAQGDNARAVLEFQDALRYQEDPGIYYALARSYSVLEKHSLAINAAREAVNRAPDNLTYRRSLAEISVAAFDIDGAIKEYREIIRRDSSALDAWYALARLYEPQKPLQAVEIYETLLRRTGPDWIPLIQLAELYGRLGENEKALGALRELLVIDPGNAALKKNVAQTYVRSGKLDSALVLYRELLERDPQNLEYRAEYAGALLLHADYDDAEREFSVILQNDSASVETKLRIGEFYFGQVEKDSTLMPRAQSIFMRIRDEHPDDWRAYWFLGAIGSMRRDDSLAAQCFRTVTQLAPWNGDAWVYLASVYLRVEDFASAAAILERAQKAVPDNFRVQFLLGVAYSRTERNADAIRSLEQARRINPKDVDATAQLALVYDAMEMHAESDSLYEEALRLDPNRPLVLNNYAYSLSERGLDLERALAMATKAVEAEPENPSYLDTIGWVYFGLGEYREAERYILKAVEKGEASAVVYEHLGDVYDKLQERDRALDFWKKALELDPDNDTLKKKISGAGP